MFKSSKSSSFKLKEYYYYRYFLQLPNKQPTIWLHDPCLEVPTVHGNELRLFLAKAYPQALTISVEHLTKQQKKLFLRLYDVVFGRDSNLSPSQQPAYALRVKPKSLVLVVMINKIIPYVHQN